MSGSNEQQQQQQPPDLNALIQQMIRQQMAAASGQQQVQLPSLPAPQAQTQYSNDPSQGPDLLARIGLALGGGSLPGAPAELRQQMGKQALLNFGIGLMSAGRFASPGEVLAGGLRGAQGGLLGREAALAGQQEYALNAQTKMAELAGQQQKNRTEALTALVPLLQLQGRMGLPPLFGGGGGPGGGGGGGGPGSDTAFTGDPEHDLPIIAQRESGGDPKALNYVAKADPTALDRGATASGKYQIVNSTWREGMQLAGLDPAQYATAMSAPEAVQDKVAQALYAKYGTRPWDASKFGANWVQQPGGGYQLVKGAPPPASGPGSAVGPYKVAGTGNVPPPTTQPSSGSGGAASPFGTGAFTPPTTTVAAPPDTTANAPNVGTAMPVPTPAMTAALAEAKRTGKPAVIEGSGGATVGPDGKFSGNVTTGRRADADAILQGVQTAQTTLPPADTVVTAGPGAGGGGTPPGAAQPAPDSAFGGGAFATAPPRFVGPVTAPAAPAQPPAAQPPAATPAAPTPTPAAAQPAPTAPTQPAGPPVSLEDYAQRHGAGTLDQPNPASVKAADENIRVAQRLLQEGYRSGASQADLTKARADVQAAQNERDRLFSDAREKFYSSIVIPAYKAEILDPSNAAALERQRGQTELEKARIQQGLNIEQKGAEASLAESQKVLTDMAGASTEARTVGNQLRLMPSIIDKLPQPGFAAQLAKDHPAIIPWMVRAGALSPEQADATQVMQGLIGYMSVGLRPTGSGALRNAEMDRFQAVLPSMMQSPEGRHDSQALLQTLQDRIVQEHDFASRYFRRIDPATGKPAYNLDGLGDAMDAQKSQGGLGPISPTGPQPVTTDANGQTRRLGPAEVQKWVHDNVGVGHAYWGWAPVGDGTYQPKLMVRRDHG